MQALRLITLVCVFSAVWGANNPLTRNDAHNIDLCPNPSVIQPTDLLTNEPFYVKAGLLQIKKEVYKFPKEGLNQRPIRCIYVKDRANDGTGGYPRIVAGGLDYYYIEIEFTSQRGKAIDFNIELYA